MNLKVLIYSLLICFAFSAKAQKVQQPPYLQGKSPWADSVFATLSLDQKIGQLFMVAAYSNRDQAHENELKTLLRIRRLVD